MVGLLSLQPAVSALVLGTRISRKAAGIKPCPGLPAFQLSQSQSSHRKTNHIVAVLAIYRCSTMAQTGVSGPVVVDGESFLDALFASAGQG